MSKKKKRGKEKRKKGMIKTVGLIFGEGTKKLFFQGKEYDIEEVDGKMITLSDGKRHRLSSCILVDKFSGGEY